MRAYSHSNPDFKLSYPEGFAIRENYRLLGDGMTQGTNLRSDSYFSVEWRDGTKCDIGLFFPNADPPKQVEYKGVVYQLATANSRVAGESYEETIYLRDCFAVRYFIHSSNGYPSLNEFNRPKLMSVFDDMRKSIVP